TRLFRWGHRFARRLRRGPHGSPGEFGAEAPLLDGEGGRRGRRRRGTCRCTSAGRGRAVCRGGTWCRWCTSTTPCSGSCCGRRRWSSGSTTPAALPSPAPPPSSSASGHALPTPARGFTEGARFPFG
ncbi:unnamed protein product, partial [Musa acuminata subsp. burmannicoides]